MNEESRYLLALAQDNAQVYIAHTRCRAIIVSGSVVEGLSDRYSDIDMILYYDELPVQEIRQEAYRQNGGSRYRLLGEEAGKALLETYLVRGVECQFAHTTIAAWEQEIAQVLELLDVTSPVQKALSGIQDAIPLYGESLLRSWQKRVVAYPDALAQAMVTHYLSFFPIWSLQQRFAARDALLWQHQIVVETLQHILGVLAGLNRLYYSTFQFKRQRRFIEHMRIAPIELATRLDAVLLANIPESLVYLEELVRETVDLVELHMPHIDISQVCRSINWQERAWELS